MKTHWFAAILFGFGLTSQALAQDKIPIATVGPMTGNYATFGAQMKAGAEAAVADINEAGGVLGKQLELHLEDDRCQKKEAIAVAEKIADKDIKFVAGHFCTDASIPASEVYAKRNVLQISPASTHPLFTDKRAGTNVFRVCGRDDQQGSIAGKYIAEHFKDKIVAILHDKTTYGKGLADETKKAMNEAGKEEVLYEAITAGERDYTAVVSKLKQANVDLVFLGGYHFEAGLIVRQMREQKMETVMMGGDALVTEEYWQITGDDGAGTLMTLAPDPRKNPAAQDLIKQFREDGIEPQGYVLYTYAAIQVWKQAVEKAGDTDVKKVAKAMSKGQLDTAIGKFKFDKKGDPVPPPYYAVYEWRDGQYEQL